MRISPISISLSCLIGLGCMGSSTKPKIAGVAQQSIGESASPPVSYIPMVIDCDFSGSTKSTLRPPIPPPPYPEEARLQGIKGTVKVVITVDLNGTPISARAIAGPELLRDAAEKYALQLKYTPLTNDGKPFVYRIEKSVEYKL